MILVGLLLFASGSVVSVDKILFQNPSSEEDLESAYISVPIIVLDSERNPIEGVRVRFISEGAPEPKLTNTDGYVRVNVPQRNDIRVILSHEEFKSMDRILDLRKDPGETRTYDMERK